MCVVCVVLCVCVVCVVLCVCVLCVLCCVCVCVVAKTPVTHSSYLYSAVSTLSNCLPLLVTLTKNY